MWCGDIDLFFHAHLVHDVDHGGTHLKSRRAPLKETWRTGESGSSGGQCLVV